MASRQSFASDFRTWHPHRNFPGVTEEEYEAAVYAYADRRIEWELENGWLCTLGFIVGVLLVWVLVGLAILYAVSKAKENASNRIAIAICRQLEDLSEYRLNPDEPF